MRRRNAGSVTVSRLRLVAMMSTCRSGTWIFCPVDSVK